MFFNGMWFQDAYNYDFATIYNSNAPVATWQGEISFCAYNGGGWRKVLESVHHTATVADWYRNHGRHQIYAAGKKVHLVESLSHRPAPLVQIEAALSVPSSRVDVGI
jgi:uncharacterized radical SAM superfamily Fe-S cluster-containing enzyme